MPRTPCLSAVWLVAVLMTVGSLVTRPASGHERREDGGRREVC